MVPESIAAVYAFLGFVAPGLVFQLLRERARPALTETTFREISRVALTSLIFTTVSVGTISYIAKRRTSLFASISDWLTHGNVYVGQNPILVSRTLLAVVATSTLLAALAHALIEWVAKKSDQRIVKTSVWYQLFIEDVPKGKAPWVGMKLADGSHAWGFVDFFTVDKELAVADREISLRGPGLTTQGASAESAKTEDYWERLCYRAEDISWLKVKYEDAVNHKKWWRRKIEINHAASDESVQEPNDRPPDAMRCDTT